RLGAVAAPGTLPITFSIAVEKREPMPYVIPKPARIVVLPAPNQGSCHASPIAGATLCQSLRTTCLSGWLDPGPTYCKAVSSDGSQLGVGSNGFWAAPLLVHCNALAEVAL